MNSSGDFEYSKRITKHYTVAVAYFTEPRGQWKGILLWEHKETGFVLEHIENGINFYISSTLLLRVSQYFVQALVLISWPANTLRPGNMQM